MNSGMLVVCFDYTWQQDASEESKSDSGGKSEVVLTFYPDGS
jgi:hypothetical protein